MEKFNNMYRIPSARASKWNYGWNAAYFVTICTKERECYFGEIESNIMHLSEIGRIVETEWLRTVFLRPDMNLELGRFVVMPNHFHGIIIIGRNRYNTVCRDAMHCVSTVEFAGNGNCRDAVQCVSTVDFADDDNCRDAMHCVSTGIFGPQSKNLASIIRGFKSSVTIQSRQIHADFAWQSRFHEHIIRTNRAYQYISNYIENNPLTWEKDSLKR